MWALIRVFWYSISNAEIIHFTLNPYFILKFQTNHFKTNEREIRR